MLRPAAASARSKLRSERRMWQPCAASTMCPKPTSVGPGSLPGARPPLKVAGSPVWRDNHSP